MKSASDNPLDETRQGISVIKRVVLGSVSLGITSFQSVNTV